jgi:hypothetical protein
MLSHTQGEYFDEKKPVTDLLRQLLKPCRCRVVSFTALSDLPFEPHKEKPGSVDH